MTTVSNLEEAFANISTTFREAFFDEETIELHITEFRQLEEKLGIDNILLRAITLPPNDDGSDIILGNTIYHWAYAEYENDKTIEVMHYRPEAPKTDEHHNFLVRHAMDKNLVPTYDKYRAVQDNANVGYRASKNYFVPPKDVRIDEEYHEIVRDIVTDVRKTMKYDQNLLRETQRDCRKYIKARLQEQLDHFHYTGKHYYLGRANFWRKLRVHHMTLSHQIIVAAAQQVWIDGFFIEEMLRRNYARKIGSL